MGGPSKIVIPPQEQPVALKAEKYNNQHVSAESRAVAAGFAATCSGLAIHLAKQMVHMKQPECCAVGIVASLFVGGFAVREAARPNVTEKLSMEATGPKCSANQMLQGSRTVWEGSGRKDDPPSLE